MRFLFFVTNIELSITDEQLSFMEGSPMGCDIQKMLDVILKPLDFLKFSE